MKKKTSLALLLCVLSGLVLAGCSQEPSSSNTATNAPSAPATNK